MKIYFQVYLAKFVLIKLIHCRFFCTTLSKKIFVSDSAPYDYQVMDDECIEEDNDIARITNPR